MPQKTFSKPLFEIMRTYSPVYPSSHQWVDTISYLIDEDSEILDELKRQYLKDGSFREAVILGQADEDDPDDMDVIADGTHRVVVAYLLGEENLTVSFDYPDYEDTGFSLATLVVPHEDDFDDEEYDVLVDKMRSFAISDDWWVTSSFASSGPEGLEIFWDEYDLNLIPYINEKFIERIKELIDISKFTITTHAATWEDPHDSDFDDAEDFNEN